MGRTVITGGTVVTATETMIADVLIDGRYQNLVASGVVDLQFDQGRLDVGPRRGAKVRSLRGW